MKTSTTPGKVGVAVVVVSSCRRRFGTTHGHTRAVLRDSEAGQDPYRIYDNVILALDPNLSLSGQEVGRNWWIIVVQGTGRLTDQRVNVVSLGL